KGLLVEAANDLAFAREKVKADKALRKKEEEMSVLFSNLPGMAYRCKNERDWTMKFISQGAKELTGPAPEDLTDNALVSYGELIVPADRDKVWNEVQQALDSDQPFELEYRIETKKGQVKYVWERGRGVYTDEGELKNLQGFISDITERKNAQNELQQSFIELAETTSRVLGVRDPYTQKHELRVGELAREVGRRMKLDKDILLGLYLGGVLHDIGKIVVPETILTKPGELTDIEWNMIKSHPKVGYNQILKDTDFPWPVAEMTLHHHERLDGSGYPDGLEGDELTTEVRILGAVDVVEAMSTRRPYRESRTKERTLGVIKDGKGDKFDPEVVDVLVEMIEEGEIVFGSE
ncbi:MAG: HD domain-containing phosphohydrolase, partial [Candidatus Aenigmatarchaeota archaeon]